jgi:hypothetical protein
LEIPEVDSYDATEIWIGCMLSEDEKNAIEKHFTTLLGNVMRGYLTTLTELVGCRGDFLEGIEKDKLEEEQKLLYQKKFAKLGEVA